MKEKEVEFLNELKNLMKKYNASIGGCGCCDSPWIEVDGSEVCCNVKINSEGIFTTEWVENTEGKIESRRKFYGAE